MHVKVNQVPVGVVIILLKVISYCRIHVISSQLIDERVVNHESFLTLMFFMDLNVDCVYALLNVIPAEELLAPDKRFSALLHKCVSIPVRAREGQNMSYYYTYMCYNPDLTHTVQDVTSCLQLLPWHLLIY